MKNKNVLFKTRAGSKEKKQKWTRLRGKKNYESRK
jgi:hypothetical protein